jgi:hypothetical protein
MLVVPECATNRARYAAGTHVNRAVCMSSAEASLATEDEACKASEHKRDTKVLLQLVAQCVAELIATDSHAGNASVSCEAMDFQLLSAAFDEGSLALSAREVLVKCLYKIAISCYCARRGQRCGTVAAGHGCSSSVREESQVRAIK